MWCLYTVTSELIMVQAEGNFKTWHEERLNLILDHYWEGSISHLPNPWLWMRPFSGEFILREDNGLNAGHSVLSEEEARGFQASLNAGSS